MSRPLPIFGLILVLSPLLQGEEEKIDFNREIRPILSDHCFQCHGPDEASLKGKLRLDISEHAIAAGAITPGKPEESELVSRILSSDPEEIMPPPKVKKPISATEADLLRRWIAEGATYAGHWAFEPVRATEPPLSESNGISGNGIDAFIFAALNKKGITPSPPADPSTLIRRMTLDLTGLLPAPERVESFMESFRTDPENAVADLADELLASPHYGERWGRHWLDQARYADSNGYSIDGDRPMWPYRDWVIRAMNDDMPFDQFTIEQIAGDLLPNPTKAQLVASGFHRNTLINQEGGTDAEQFRNEEVVDRVNTTGAVWLGLTLGCAQCHTHKFDPITHREYYEMFAFFNQGEDVNNVGATVEVGEGELFLTNPDPAKLAAVETARAALAALISSRAKRQIVWETSVLTGDKPFLDALQTPAEKRSAEQKKLLIAAFVKADVTEIAAGKALRDASKALGIGAPVRTMVMRDLANPRETFIHLRGSFLDHDLKTGPLSPGVPAMLPALPIGEEGKSKNRLDLARWLVRPDHPLTPRVTVNRIWMHYFGKGIVETENDFGTQGTFPSHPALLDWLATQFIDGGWSMKNLHKIIVTSATYRQSSFARPDLTELDPLNHLLARQNRIRVEAEIVRDAALAASGLLSPKVGGPGVLPPQPEGVYAFTQTKKTWTAATGPDRFRRALYTQFYRSAPYPLLTTFDSPDFQSTCTGRVRSNTPLQSLTLANDESLFEMAQGLGERLLREIPGEDATANEARIERAFQLCYSRPPAEGERYAVASFQESQRDAFQKSPTDAAAVASKNHSKEITPAAAASWTAVARALMNTDEFITRE